MGVFLFVCTQGRPEACTPCTKYRGRAQKGARAGALHVKKSDSNKLRNDENLTDILRDKRFIILCNKFQGPSQIQGPLSDSRALLDSRATLGFKGPSDIQEFISD